MVSISIKKNNPYLGPVRAFQKSGILNSNHLCLFVSLLCAFSLSSQNLVKNPSFENFAHCPQRLGNFDKDVISWSMPTEGSTDYFNACSTSMGTPENFNGKQPAEFGKGYSGFYLYAPEDYREYLQAELTGPLEKDVAYQVSFYVSLAERSDFAIKEFGVLFAKDKLEVAIKKELSKSYWYRQKDNVYNYLEIGYTNFYADTQDWISVSTRFVAKGGEKYMILGNFKNNARTRKFKTEYTAKQGAYYYLDMVEVKVANADHTASVENSDQNTNAQKSGTGINDKNENFTLDKIHVFENVLFDFDHFEVLQTAEKELRRIVDYLKSHPTARITINGHTDTSGSAAYNQWLSDKRAKAVADYLLRTGITKNRISWKGFGGNKPIAVNTTEAGRKKNRRVEFVISNPNTP